MRTKLLSLIVMALPAWTIVHAQDVEPTDSLIHELQEVIITARHPVTKLVGSTLVSTIAGSNLQNAGNALDVLQQLPMLTVEDNSISVTGKGSPAIYIDGWKNRRTLTPCAVFI